MLQQQQQLELLPLAWLRKLVDVLPAHSRLRLRQCSKQMQQLVDASGVGLRLTTSLDSSLALQLCKKQLASLDVTGVPNMTQTGDYNMKMAESSLPCLKKVFCDMAQIVQFVEIARCAPRLEHLRLSCKADLTEQHQEIWSKLHLQLPGLATQLRCFEMEKACHKQFAERTWMWPLVGACRNLDTLIMHVAKPHGYSVERRELSDAAWQAAVQPLTKLTRLDMGMRTFATAAEDGTGMDIEPVNHGEHQQGGVGISSNHVSLPKLQQLKCFGFDSPVQDSWNLSWVGWHTNLTSLNLMCVSSGEVDFDVLSQLRQLCSLTMHCYPDELFTSSQLSTLSSCTQLTCLRLDSLLVEPGHMPVQSSLGPSGSSDFEYGSQAACSEGLARAPGRSPVCLPQLTSLKKLVAGLLCKAPVSTLAPSLTQLRDLDYDLAELELFSCFIDEKPPLGQEPLADLQHLELLAVNINALVRHALYPSLTASISLRELHIDMVGNLTNTCISAYQSGLPWIAGLTRLVLTLAPKAMSNLEKTYSTEEDVLLWKNQRSVRHLRLRGTKLLGGFMVHDEYMELLPTSMPQLQTIELVKCSDLNVADLSKLVNIHAAHCVVVQGCEKIVERDCVQLTQDSQGAVTVEYLMP